MYTVKECLDIEKQSATPGAFCEKFQSYVWYDEEWNAYHYIPDITPTLRTRDHWVLTDMDMLSRLVLGYSELIWVPVSNFIFE